VTNTGTTAASFNLSCNGTGGVTLLTINPSPTGTLQAEESIDVDDVYDGPYRGKLSLYATAPATDSGWVNLRADLGTAPRYHPSLPGSQHG
jgi:hypothetical protein